MNDLKVVFMGNGSFAVPSLRLLYERGISLKGVVTNPPKRIGRGKRLKLTAVGQEATNLGLNVLPTEELKSSAFLSEIKSLHTDLFIVVAYKILPEELIALPKFGAINLHPSLLPAYRGAAPIQWALINGEIVTGITTFQIQKTVDSGNILLQEKINIDPEDNHGTLSERLSIKGAKLILKTIEKIRDPSLQQTPQNESLVTYAPKIKKSQCTLDWQQPALKLVNLIRALSPKPGAFSIVCDKRFKFLRASVINNLDKKLPPGCIVKRSKTELWIQTGAGQLAVEEIQAEGKKKLGISDFLKGSNLKVGDQFG
jgi:methionyl-tRNA formyltransferase